MEKQSGNRNTDPIHIPVIRGKGTDCCRSAFDCGYEIFVKARSGVFAVRVTGTGQTTNGRSNDKVAVENDVLSLSKGKSGNNKNQSDGLSFLEKE